MENQHKKIKGYRDLTQDEIDLMNEIKGQGEKLGNLIQKLSHQHTSTGNHSIDIRWLQDAEMQLKKGIMSLVRSVARPESF
jgi:hypothetical protein